MIRFGQMTEDEVFVSAKAAKEGVVVENTGSEPLVSLRYFGPDAQPAAAECRRSQETLNSIGRIARRPMTTTTESAVVSLCAE